MEQQYALLSIIFMIGYVLLFDRVHRDHQDARFCSANLIGAQDLDRILQIMSACEDV